MGRRGVRQTCRLFRQRCTCCRRRGRRCRRWRNWRWQRRTCAATTAGAAAQLTAGAKHDGGHKPGVVPDSSGLGSVIARLCCRPRRQPRRPLLLLRLVPRRHVRRAGAVLRVLRGALARQLALVCHVALKRALLCLHQQLANVPRLPLHTATGFSCATYRSCMPSAITRPPPTATAALLPPVIVVRRGGVAFCVCRRCRRRCRCRCRSRRLVPPHGCHRATAPTAAVTTVIVLAIIVIAKRAPRGRQLPAHLVVPMTMPPPAAGRCWCG